MPLKAPERSEERDSSILCAVWQAQSGEPQATK